jgi:hypothetical protein
MTAAVLMGVHGSSGVFWARACRHDLALRSEAAQHRSRHHPFMGGFVYQLITIPIHDCPESLLSLTLHSSLRRSHKRAVHIAAPTNSSEGSCGAAPARRRLHAQRFQERRDDRHHALSQYEPRGQDEHEAICRSRSLLIDAVASTRQASTRQAAIAPRRTGSKSQSGTTARAHHRESRWIGPGAGGKSQPPTGMPRVDPGPDPVHQPARHPRHGPVRLRGQAAGVS